MWRSTWRSLIAHKLRLAFSGLAIVLGVAFVGGTMIFTDTLNRTFTVLFASSAADVSVRPAAAYEEGMSGQSGTTARVPSALVDQVRAVDGVAAAEGYVQTEGVYVLDRAGDVLDTGGAPGVGVSWFQERDLSPSDLSEGRAPAGRGEVALDVTTAEKIGYAVGDRVTLLTPGPRVEAEVVGLFTFGEDGGLAGASLTAFDRATAQSLLGLADDVTAIDVLAADGVSDDELRDRIASAIGTGYEVTTAQEQADEQAAALEDGLSFITVLLTAFAGIALFVGSFIILNTFSMLVAQRTRELALLRALGAGRAQVTRSVLTEALVLGITGSSLGLLGGFGIASALRALFSRLRAHAGRQPGPVEQHGRVVLLARGPGDAARGVPAGAQGCGHPTGRRHARGPRRRGALAAPTDGGGHRAGRRRCGLTGRQRSVRRHRRDAAGRARRARARAGRHRPQPGTGPTVRPVRGRRPAPAVVDRRPPGPRERPAQPSPYGRHGVCADGRPGARVGLQHPRVLRQRLGRQADRHRRARRLRRLHGRRSALHARGRRAAARRGRRAGRHAGAFGLER
jgi:ABC-type lipoprotein release transport system permease subunit